MNDKTLDAEQSAELAPANWLFDDDELAATFATGDFARGVQLVNAIAEQAEAADHHPDILLTYPEVIVSLSSHDVGGVTERDIRLAERINHCALDMGVDLHQ